MYMANADPTRILPLIEQSQRRPLKQQYVMWRASLHVLYVSCSRTRLSIFPQMKTPKRLMLQHVEYVLESGWRN